MAVVGELVAYQDLAGDIVWISTERWGYKFGDCKREKADA